MLSMPMLPSRVVFVRSCSRLGLGSRSVLLESDLMLGAVASPGQHVAGEVEVRERVHQGAGGVQRSAVEQLGAVIVVCVDLRGYAGSGRCTPSELCRAPSGESAA